jgi:hypothetical protein
MLKEFLRILQILYTDFEFELCHRASIILDHGQFVESIRSNNDLFVIYRLDKTFKYKFAVVHFAFDSHKINRILLLDNLEIDGRKLSSQPNYKSQTKRVEVLHHEF